MDLDELSHVEASSLTEENEINKVLSDFVIRVREGRNLSKYHLAFIADGVENYLAGKKAWPSKRGIKKSNLLVTFPYFYAYLENQGTVIKGHKAKASVANEIINRVHKTDDSDAPNERTVQRYIALALDELIEHPRIKNIMNFTIWCLVEGKEIPSQFE